MERSSATVRRGVTPLLGALLGVVLTGCGGSPAPAPPPSRPVPTASPTPLSQLGTEGLTAVRTEFCSRLTQTEISTAVGSTTAPAPVTWHNGDTAQVGGVSDVVHEWGCRFVAGARTASAWVFAPPVSPARADFLAQSAARAHGCNRLPGSTDFGTHSVATACGQWVTYSGLFGDAWLSCSLGSPEPLAARLDDLENWCAAVVMAARS